MEGLKAGQELNEKGGSEGDGEGVVCARKEVLHMRGL